jgi:hypothetical protein
MLSGAKMAMWRSQLPRSACGANRNRHNRIAPLPH